jgi:epoxyqueuosine reductase
MDEIRVGPKNDNCGCFSRMISIGHLQELRKEVEEQHRKGRFDESFYKELETKISFEAPPELPDAQTILVVSRPQPSLSVSVRWKGEDIPLTVPPGYADIEDMDTQALAALNNLLRPGPYRYVKARLPLRLLAAHSGLVKYGRNNITYLPRFGSFHRLTAFFSDAPCLEDQWQEVEQLPGCDSCDACLRACPTGAIVEEQFMMRAERCLTQLNEKDASEPFPEWVDTLAHNALVGCMRCQRVCPYNKNVVYWSLDRGSLSEEETALLLSTRRTGEDVRSLEGKLQGMGLSLSTFPRNLAALLDNRH